MARTAIVTTSWDDGHPCDLRLAEALAMYRLPATFYVPLYGEDGKPVLEASALRSLLKQGFEIGAHTVTHQTLPELNDAGLIREVDGSKRLMEDQLGAEVRMFCYPRGRYDSRVIDIVRQSGFHGARTTGMLSQSLRFGQFEMPTSLQAFPHPRVNYLKNLGKRGNLAGFARYFAKYSRCANWLDMGKAMFDDVLREGGIWHLYGHSWELEDLGLWDQLHDLFRYVADRPGVIYTTNCNVLQRTSKAA